MYYKAKTGQHSFIPESRTWSQCFPDHSKGSPATALFRLIFSTSLLFLAVFGGVGGRFVAMGLVVGTFLLPVEMIGYVRYTPWIVELILAGVMMACANWMGRVDYVVMIPMAFFVAVKAPGFFLRRAEKIDNAYGINLVLSKSPPRTLVPEMWGWHFSDNLRLLKRQVPELACSEVAPEAEVRRRPSGEAAELEFFFGCGFKIPSGSAPIRYEDYHCVRERPSRKIFVLRSFFVTLPVNVWNSLKGLGSGK